MTNFPRVLETRAAMKQKLQNIGFGLVLAVATVILAVGVYFVSQIVAQNINLY